MKIARDVIVFNLANFLPSKKEEEEHTRDTVSIRRRRLCLWDSTATCKRKLPPDFFYEWTSTFPYINSSSPRTTHIILSPLSRQPGVYLDNQPPAKEPRKKSKLRVDGRI
ncbi:hypothetical protein NPIL_291481 [Nephila pilipes]|uniref:Uncharacterized protein n=1 Tax=Nephila pilipes TaxID=299642 RepID=A0A8X6P5X7_NEPPI|nr:hypothetical protein NPIL_291481 [Nephila pilipes]